PGQRATGFGRSKAGTTTSSGIGTAGARHVKTAMASTAAAAASGTGSVSSTRCSRKIAAPTASRAAVAPAVVAGPNRCQYVTFGAPSPSNDDMASSTSIAT